mmetsp:Transcript_35311/g.89000  ORF Transcript_35311/g.89000 Transcript_35311/m.89000 type:complete len:221 (+) Transcript_35311:58-720(+)
MGAGRMLAWVDEIYVKLRLPTLLNVGVVPHSHTRRHTLTATRLPPCVEACFTVHRLVACGCGGLSQCLAAGRCQGAAAPHGGVRSWPTSRGRGPHPAALLLCGGVGDRRGGVPARLPVRHSPAGVPVPLSSARAAERDPRHVRSPGRGVRQPGGHQGLWRRPTGVQGAQGGVPAPPGVCRQRPRRERGSAIRAGRLRHGRGQRGAGHVCAHTCGLPSGGC